MAKNAPLTEDEAQELFSELDDSGVIDPLLAHRRVRGGDAAKADDEARREDVQVGLNLRRARRAKVDPLSEQDPSGSKAGEAISRTAILCIVGVLLFVVGMQIVYGVSRRLNTANLSECADYETVTNAMQSGVEWGNGFTQFPEQFTVDEADERTGVVEVSVVDTQSKNELWCTRCTPSQTRRATLPMTSYLALCPQRVPAARCLRLYGLRRNRPIQRISIGTSRLSA